MKLGMFLMLAGLVGALVVGPMYMKGPTGQPIMTMDDWTPDALEQPMNLTAEAPAGVYRWTDEQGVVHYSDEKPAHLDTASIETLDVGHTMTLPSEAFTGPEREQAETAGMPEPLRVLLKNGGRGGHSSGPAEAGAPATSAEAMNGALAEIAQRFPQFKEMSDQLAQQMSQPEGQ